MKVSREFYEAFSENSEHRFTRISATHSWAHLEHLVWLTIYDIKKKEKEGTTVMTQTHSYTRLAARAYKFLGPSDPGN
jgi:hypothetical protein